jgi:heme/copper-type cytochrome/quinol oxidase subunit 3
MAAEHAAVAENPNIGTTGLDHRKMGMWAFLGSECMFFGSLIGTYLSYKGKSINGPGPHDILNIPLTSLSAFVLLMSSLLMVLALAAVQRNDMKWGKIWLFMTALFVALRGLPDLRVHHFVHLGLTLQTNLFGSTFFVLTGFHGAHVTGGVIWLLAMWWLAVRGKLGPQDSLKVEICGLYWHFVDIVWIVIFALIYLIP